MADIDEESFSRQNSQAHLMRPVPGPSTIVPIDPEVTLSNGVKMPTIGLGTFQVKKEECYKVVLYALKVGYRCIDTAKVYKNEAVIGRAIKDSRINRTSVFITSKLSPADHGYQQAREAFFESLDDLSLDYLDLYLIHWPAAQGIPMTSDQNAVKRRESWKALESLYKEGKVRAIGVSNYTVRQLEQLLEHAEIKPHVNQVEFHPQCQQKELIAFCDKHGIKVVGYSPLGQGRLLDHEDIMKIARRRNLSPATLLLRWNLRKNIPMVVKTVKANRLIENLKTFETEITQQEIEMLDALDENVHYCWDPSGIP